LVSTGSLPPLLGALPRRLPPKCSNGIPPNMIYDFLLIDILLSIKVD
jgi:hypothetical protein